MDKSTLIKAQYMIAALKPEEFSNYKMYIGEETIKFKYGGDDAELNKGVLVNIHDDNISWNEFKEEDFKRLNNQEFFDIILFRFIGEIIYEYWKKQFPGIDEKIDRFSFEKTLEPLTRDEKFKISLEIEKFLDENENIQTFFNSNNNYSPLFKNPICLLLFYLIKAFQTKTIENWNFSDVELKELFRIMNISEDII